MTELIIAAGGPRVVAVLHYRDKAGEYRSFGIDKTQRKMAITNP
jgi:hypothetical protein